MTEKVFRLTKFDVAERQLHQAVRLFFAGGDPVSVHTLAEAAAQVLSDTGSESLLRDNPRIRRDKRKEWLEILAKSRNFFKHADRDPHAVHEFKESFNHFVLADACSMCSEQKGSFSPETMVYTAWFMGRYPQVVKSDSTMSEIVERMSNPAHLSERELFELAGGALVRLRSGDLSLSQVALWMGRTRF